MGGKILQCVYPENDVGKQVETPIFLYSSVVRHSSRGSVIEVLLCVSLIVCTFIASDERVGTGNIRPETNSFIKGVLINKFFKIYFQEL